MDDTRVFADWNSALFSGSSRFYLEMGQTVLFISVTDMISIAIRGRRLAAHGFTQRPCSVTGARRKYSLVSARRIMYPTMSAHMQVARGSSSALSPAQTCSIMFCAFVGLPSIMAARAECAWC